MDGEATTELLYHVLDDQLYDTLEEADRLNAIDWISHQKAPNGKKTILAILERAATDTSFVAALLDDPDHALRNYDLGMEEKSAISGGNIRQIERWTGELKPEHRKWLWRRLRQERL